MESHPNAAIEVAPSRTPAAIVEALRAGAIVDARDIYVDGKWEPSTGSGPISVEDPSTEQVIAQVADGAAADVERAVAAARAAFAGWSALPPAVRADYLLAASTLLTAAAEELAEIASRDVGCPIGFSRAAQIGLPVFHLGYYAELARTYDFDGERLGNSLVVKDPVGVVAAITPWNYPAHQAVLKIAAALAAGCTVVIKPSEVAPLLVHAIVAIFDEAGLPPGVLNLVSGRGDPVGEALVAHPDVDMISFTGSTRAGQRIGAVAAQGIKRVALELGGKSANVILDDADLPRAVAAGLAACVGPNSGQTCTALTRMLVPAERLAEVEALAIEGLAAYPTGAWDEPGARVGPLVSRTQQDRVVGYIRRGIEDGARLLAGGGDVPDGAGYFVAPTIFSGVDPSMTIAREEIFGPVLSIIPYADEEDAVRIANDTSYGLAAAVWSGDDERALRVARRLQSGQVQVNGAAYNALAPFGGFKQSGLGREGGPAGIEEFLETKAIQL